MKILLTHGYFLKEDPAELKIMKPYPPLGMLYISAWLEKKKIGHELFDTTFSDFEKQTGYSGSFHPDVIGIYTTLKTKRNVLRLISFIRKNEENHETFIIIGGPDGRYQAENYLHHGADMIIPGEGEITFEETLDCISSGQENFLSRNDQFFSLLRNVPGIIFRNNTGEIIRTAERKLLAMAELPFPARHRVDIEQYMKSWKEKHGYASLTISSMRGCPYSCNWCSKNIYGNTYRRRDPSLVVDEIEWIKSTFNPDQLWFTDDVFTISKEWMKKFAGELHARDLNLPYECISRTDCMDDEMIGLLIETGCRKLWIGAESGSQRVLDLMNRKTDINKTIEVFRNLHKNGIASGTFLMLGYPGETKKDILQTASFLKLAKPDEMTITMAYPIKGTRFYEEEESSFLSPYNWETMTDRDIQYKKPYNRRFYRFAIRYLFNRFNTVRPQQGYRRFIYFLKYKLSRLAMEILQII